MNLRSGDHRSLPAQASVALLASLGALLALYSIIRYQGLWGEIDTRNAAVFIRHIYETGDLIPARGAYPNGYSYQALIVLLMNTTGLSAASWQIFGASLLAVWVVAPAWLVYRELTGTARAATLATVILLVQPEFLFGIMRGTHEKFTRGLMLLGLYLLLRSLRSRSRPVRFAALVLAFYLTVYALISFNNLIAMSFVLAILLALLLIGVLSYARRLDLQPARPAVRRLALILTASLVLGFLFTFFLYQPAQHGLSVLETIADRVAALFLDMEAESTNPYTQWVGGAWVSLSAYFIMTVANWLLLLASAVIWLWQSATWFIRRQWPEEQREVLLWAFYGAFAFMGALSIVVDASGVLSANLQHRAFPSFGMLAAPLVAVWLTKRIPQRAPSARRSYAALGLLIMALAALSMLKATNEPLLSNKWLFYTPAEMTAIDWAETSLADRQVWTSLDERVPMAADIRRGERPATISYDTAAVAPGTHDFLLSDVTRAQQIRTGFPSPAASDALRTYDNGQAQIYHRRPMTPYQR